MAIAELPCQLLGHRYGSMPPTGTPEGDCQIGLSLTRVLRQQVIEQRSKVSKELPCLRSAQDVRRDLGIQSSLRTQGLDEVRVWQEAQIEYQVSMHGNTVLEAKRDETNDHRRSIGIATNVLGQLLSQLVNAEVRGVDDDVGARAESREPLALSRNRTMQVPGLGKSVRSPSLTESPHEYVVGAVQENDLDAVPRRFELRDRLFGAVQEGTCANVDAQSDLLELPLSGYQRQ